MWVSGTSEQAAGKRVPWWKTLPDDEDDCRDLIDDDYQLKSDIETFEHFTGKVIRPPAAVED